MTATDQSAGLLGRFATVDALLAAVRAARASGLRRLDAFTPFTIDELPDALELPPSRLRIVMFVAGFCGAVAGLAMQRYSAVEAYPINSGGRPLSSWPAFIPVAFELAVLFAATAGLVTFIVTARLSELHHPLFDVGGFEAVTNDGFFLLVAADDPAFERIATEQSLRDWGATSIAEVRR